MSGIRSVHHAGIVVRDMNRSLPFYRDLLGLKVWADYKDESDYVCKVTDVPGARLWIVKLQSPGGGMVELLQYLSHPQEAPPPSRSCDVGCNHIALEVEDIDALYEKLVAGGIRFHSPPLLSSNGTAKVTYCRDPEGVIVELMQFLSS